VAPPRALRLPLDPVLTLAVIGLGICSMVTLAAATRNLVPGRPSYYVWTMPGCELRKTRSTPP